MSKIRELSILSLLTVLLLGTVSAAGISYLPPTIAQEDENGNGNGEETGTEPEVEASEEPGDESDEQATEENDTATVEEEEALNVSVNAAHDPLQRGLKQTLTINSDPNVDIKGLVTYQSGFTRAFDGTTDAAGIFEYTWEVGPNANTGEFNVKVTAANGDQIAAGETTFNVVAKGQTGTPTTEPTTPGNETTEPVPTELPTPGEQPIPTELPTPGEQPEAGGNETIPTEPGVTPSEPPTGENNTTPGTEIPGVNASEPEPPVVIVDEGPTGSNQTQGETTTPDNSTDIGTSNQSETEEPIDVVLPDPGTNVTVPESGDTAVNQSQTPDEATEEVENTTSTVDDAVTEVEQGGGANDTSQADMIQILADSVVELYDAAIYIQTLDPDQRAGLEEGANRLNEAISNGFEIIT